MALIDAISAELKSSNMLILQAIGFDRNDDHWTGRLSAHDGGDYVSDNGMPRGEATMAAQDDKFGVVVD